MSKRIVVIRNITASKINLSPVEICYGHPGLPAIYGFCHALQRKINEDGHTNVSIGGFALATVKQNINIVEYNKYKKRFAISRNPYSVRNVNFDSGVPIIEECTGDGVYNLVFILEGTFNQKVKNSIKNNIRYLRFAGGVIESFDIDDSSFMQDDEEGSLAALRSLMPGSILVDRHKMLADYAERNNCDMLDALLDYMCIIDVKKDNKKNKDDEKRYRPKTDEAGWYIPIFAGYQRITDFQKNISGVQNNNYKQCFVESVITLAECVLPIRQWAGEKPITLDNILWHPVIDEDQNYFVFQQKNE